MMNTINRRRFLQGTGLGFAAFALSRNRKVMADPYGMPIGLQLYTVRDHLEKDLAGAFARVAAIGYKVVELGGSFNFYGKRPAELKQMLNDAGLHAISTHFTEQQLKADLEKQIADSKECGITYAGLASLDDKDRESLDAIKRDADWFNQVGEAANKAGCHFFYHGHNFDYATADGVVVYDELIRRTDPKLANFELDCFWCVRAGKDPVDYFRRFPGRFPQLHIKDLKPGYPPTTGEDFRPGAFTEVGQGVIDWKRIFRAALEGGMKYFYVEQDECDRDSLESARISYDYLHVLSL
jgi:sugar phosphate isomerase/epimerase